MRETERERESMRERNREREREGERERERERERGRKMYIYKQKISKQIACTLFAKKIFKSSSSVHKFIVTLHILYFTQRMYPH